MPERVPWVFVCGHPQRPQQRWGEPVFGDRFLPVPRGTVTRGRVADKEEADLVAAAAIAPATRQLIRGTNALHPALRACAVWRLLQQARDLPFRAGGRGGGRGGRVTEPASGAGSYTVPGG